MPWRGPEVPGEFPTLGYLVGEWIEAHCVIPDRAVAGRPFKLSEQQWNHLLWQFRLKPDAEYDEDRPAAPFVYTGSLLVRSQKWGKGPFSSARICAQAAGPVLFGGWDAAGEPVGIPWATPHIQVAAVAEDQTDNIWRALKPMIELGPLADLIPDTGLDRINLPGGGIIEPVSSNALTRLGARITYLEVDQPESMTRANGGEKLVDTLLRNLAGMGGRWSATGNAHDPTEQSVQQNWIERPLADVFIDYPDPLPGSWLNRRERRRILKHAYAGSPWVDIDRIEADCDRLAAKGDPGQAERFFGNRVVAGSAQAFDLEVYKPLKKLLAILPGRKVVAGFDGSLSNDATGLVVCDIETGHRSVVGWWKRPEEIPEHEEWQVPLVEVNEAVAFLFSTWDVWRLYADPPHYRDDLNRWAGEYGADRVVEWWTNARKRMAYALREYRTDMVKGEMSHGPLLLSEDAVPSPEALEAHAALVEHVGNAVRRPTNIRDEDDGSFLWLIGKASAKSPHKIDLCMADVLANVGRGDAIRAGVLQQQSYGVARWGNDTASPGKRVTRADYLPCAGCGKPIHPDLHAEGAPERGRCMKCRTTGR